uniref:DUF6589 domain-containing protein n=1 Tax=Amphimedon queenslandica TaxID=400682 RepID=A0A1X7U207_AMPQE
MASLEDKCLACGEAAVKRARVKASTVSEFLKKYLRDRCTANNLNVDLDAIIAVSFVCRSCSKVYLSHQAKDLRLYEATSATVSLLASYNSSQAHNLPSESATPISTVTHSECSLPPSPKRRCIASPPDSPPIVVTVGHSSGERSYLLNTPRRKAFIRTISRTKNSAKSIARSALSDTEVMKYLSVGTGKQLKYELKKLATMNVNSIQKSSNKSDIKLISSILFAGHSSTMNSYHIESAEQFDDFDAMNANCHSTWDNESDGEEMNDTNDFDNIFTSSQTCEVLHVDDGNTQICFDNESIDDTLAPPSFSNISSESVVPDNIESSSVGQGQWYGFKIVGDNLDKNISRRHQRIDRKTRSFHFFNSFAVKDRIDLSSCSQCPNPFYSKPILQLPIDTLLPSVPDDEALIANFSTIVSRVLVAEFSFFSDTFEDVVVNHIQHDYYTEMSQKSETTPLGVIFKNENVVEDMIDIMLKLQSYAPTEHSTVVDGVSGSTISFDVTHEILLGGDQLTRKRAESAKFARRNSPIAAERLDGLIPVCEDWHAKKIFLEMIWAWMYKGKSFLEKGTLCHLRNVIDRRNISAKAADDFNACEDFFVTVVKCHIVVAAMQFFQMEAASDSPVHDLLVADLWTKPKQERKEVLDKVTRSICLNYVDVLAHYSLDEDVEKDGVMSYAVAVLSQGLLYMEFSDAIREGDGSRILRCWRYFMIIFKHRQRKNYCQEALNILGQYHFFLTARQSQQLVWSRCINVHGIPGRNIPCDLFLEHLNRICKQSVEMLGSNFSEEALERVGRCVGIINSLLENFDKDLSVPDISGSHSIASSEKDKSAIIKELLEADIFNHQDNRKHATFQSIKTNPVSSLRYNEKFHKWIQAQLFSLKIKFI